MGARSDWLGQRGILFPFSVVGLSAILELAGLMARSSPLAEISFWVLALGLVGALLLAPLTSARNRVALALCLAAWIFRRDDPALPSLFSPLLVLAALALIPALKTAELTLRFRKGYLARGGMGRGHSNQRKSYSESLRHESVVR